MGFNKEQQKAIDTTLDTDVLISAGAGSGKTKTLSEKVYTLIKSRAISPSELLVLTFTDNAAHEMKTRIIARFADSPELAKKMTSSHVQTFDSFAHYLVTSYSGRLGISDRLNIVHPDVLDTKIRTTLEDVFDDAYGNPLLKEKMTELLRKFSFFGDDSVKKIVLDLYAQLNKMLPREKERFLSDYTNHFESESFFRELLKGICDASRKLIIRTLYEAYFSEVHYDDYDSCDTEKLNEVFANDRFFLTKYDHLSFGNEINGKIYEEVLKVLKTEDDASFVSRIKTFREVHENLIPKSAGKLSQYNHSDPDIAVYRIFRSLFYGTTDTEPLLSVLLNLSEDTEEEKRKFLSFREETSLLFTLVNELDRRIEEDKRVTNSFTFFDIDALAIALLTEEKYADIAEEIRCRFRFIMVDEYQDTNDLQELLLESLLKVNHKGERSHLFCVGDAKQSIYAFRASRVELFRKRMEKYQKNPGQVVIPMNRNYRSGKKLLQDINYIFNFYMTLVHGDISYKDESEQLKYDEEANVYSLSYDGFGVSRIVSKSGVKNDGYSAGSKEWEALAIIKDIQDKVKSGYPVSEKTSHGNVLRPCRYSDFAILMRTKSGFTLYQKLFTQYGIKLNVTASANLREIDAVILIQSLIRLIANTLYEDPETDVRHLFASVARSYAYQYSDQAIFDLVTSHDENDAPDHVKDDLRFLYEDPLMVQVQEFAEAHRSSSFLALFDDMINEFHVVEKLYAIGSVADNLAKIESLRSMVEAQEESGEGIREFCTLLESISKYDLELSGDSVVKTEDAVDMMTIHASKGLERKIVYLPFSYNKLMKGSALTKPDYVFSRKYGLIFPYYGYDYHRTDADGNVLPVSIRTVASLLYDMLGEEKNENISEHVRLFYVALTRAENAIIIVGDPPKHTDKSEESARKEENLYGMLFYLPHCYRIDDAFLRKMEGKGVLTREFSLAYKAKTDKVKSIDTHVPSESFSEDEKKTHEYLYDRYYVKRLASSLEEDNDYVMKEAFARYYQDFSAGNYSLNLDFMSRVFAMKEFAYPARNYRDLHDYLYVERPNEVDEIEMVPEDEEEPERHSPIPENELEGRIFDLGKRLYEKQLKELGYSENRIRNAGKNKEHPDVPNVLVPDYLLPFAYAFDGLEILEKLDFTNQDFQDRFSVFDYHELQDGEKEIVPGLPDLQVDDTPIDFPVRSHARASKLHVADPDSPANDILETGTRLHRLMELVDLKSKDTSFIKDEQDRKIIDSALGSPLFENLGKATIYKELGYYDERMDTTGFIDLLIVKDGHYTVVDYKTDHIDDHAYDRQLRIYQRAVMERFGVNAGEISLVLLSLAHGKIRYVECE